MDCNVCLHIAVPQMSELTLAEQTQPQGGAETQMSKCDNSCLSPGFTMVCSAE